MRVGRLLLSVVSLIALFSAPSVFGQQATASSAQAPPPDPQATALLTQSVAALTGGQSIADVTLSGSARRIAGSDDEAGTAVLKALATGEARMDLSFPSGPRSEIVAFSNQCPAGRWSGPDGVSHPVANHNLMSDSSWFFPAFTVHRLSSTSKYVVSYVGHQTWRGRAVEHLTAYQPFNSQAPAGVPTFSQLTQMDLLLDSSTLLPARLAFNVHADNDMGLDIPVEIVFSDYRIVNGAQVPFHIQKSLNNSLSLDFQAQTVTPNSGLSAADFTVGAGV